MVESNNPFDLMKEEMENDDVILIKTKIQIKVNAIHRMSIILAFLTQEKIISDLLPYINKLLLVEEDEVLLAFAEELSKFKIYLDTSGLVHILPTFQILLCAEETVVREQCLESFREYTKLFTDDQIHNQVCTLVKDLFIKINTISNQEYFTGKVSSCYLIRMIYDRAGKEKEKLRNLYYKLCDDETPLIKKAAAKELGPLCTVMEKEVVTPDMINYFKKFMVDSDNIKVTALASLVQLVKLFQNTDQQRLNVQIVVAAGDDKSWRVRHELARIFPLLIEGFGNQINELVPTFGTLIKDSETEVRLVALEGLNKVIRFVNPDKVTACIIPAILSLQNESSVNVKYHIGHGLGQIAKSVGYTTFNAKLSGVLDWLMKDENSEVRLGLTRSLFEIYVASEGQLLPSTSNILGVLLKDVQWRIRETVIEILSKLGQHFGIDVFKNNLENLYFNYIIDTVSNVRESGVKGLEILITKFGSSWVINSLIPKLLNYLSQPKISYLHRMCILSSLSVCSKSLNSNQINELVLPSLFKYLKDKVPNVRFFCIKLLEDVVKYVDTNTKESKIKPVLKENISDDDLDVKYFAQRFLSSL